MIPNTRTSHSHEASLLIHEGLVVSKLYSMGIFQAQSTHQSPQVAVALIERDTHGDVMCVWSYPSIDNASESVLLSRAFPSEDEGSRGEWFSKHRNVWQYYATTDEMDSLTSPNVQV